MTKFVKIRSWHAATSPYKTLCGKTVTNLIGVVRPENYEAQLADDLPLNEKSCETCLRLLERELELND